MNDALHSIDAYAKSNLIKPRFKKIKIIFIATLWMNKMADVAFKEDYKKRLDISEIFIKLYDMYVKNGNFN